MSFIVLWLHNWHWRPPWWLSGVDPGPTIKLSIPKMTKQPADIVASSWPQISFDPKVSAHLFPNKLEQIKPLINGTIVRTSRLAWMVFKIKLYFNITEKWKFLVTSVAKTVCCSFDAEMWRIFSSSEVKKFRLDKWINLQARFGVKGCFCGFFCILWTRYRWANTVKAQWAPLLVTNTIHCCQFCRYLSIPRLGEKVILSICWFSVTTSIQSVSAGGSVCSHFCIVALWLAVKIIFLAPVDRLQCCPDRL